MRAYLKTFFLLLLLGFSCFIIQCPFVSTGMECFCARGWVEQVFPLSVEVLVCQLSR